VVGEAGVTVCPPPRFDHLDAMTAKALFEHAELATPRPEHGYCTDDNARLLVVAGRSPDDPVARRLADVALRFTLASLSGDGRVRNRMNTAWRWQDDPATDDCWGRALWAFGATAAGHRSAATRAEALVAFARAAQVRSVDVRAMAYAALGAAAVVSAQPTHRAALRLLDDAAARIGEPTADDVASGWTWPEPTLRYGNATLAEALIAAGVGLDRREVLDRGLAMLAWLLARETAGGHLSVTPVGGSGPADRGPRFDQQPIEVVALADACVRAFDATGDHIWSDGVRIAADWFVGDNDGGHEMFDSSTNGGYDGLMIDGVNRNQGAESTLAFVATMQHAARLGVVA
jgi:hypothetical protein